MSRATRVLLLTAVVVLIGALAAGAWIRHQLTAPESAARGALDVEVPRGASTSSVAELLERRGVVRDARIFAWLARVRGDAGRIQAGRYGIPGGLAAPEVLDLLVEGRTTLVRVSVPERSVPEPRLVVQAPTLAVRQLATSLTVLDAPAAAASEPGWVWPESGRPGRGVDAGQGRRPQSSSGQPGCPHKSA